METLETTEIPVPTMETAEIGSNINTADAVKALVVFGLAAVGAVTVGKWGYKKTKEYLTAAKAVRDAKKNQPTNNN